MLILTLYKSHQSQAVWGQKEVNKSLKHAETGIKKNIRSELCFQFIASISKPNTEYTEHLQPKDSGRQS